MPTGCSRILSISDNPASGAIHFLQNSGLRISGIRSWIGFMKSFAAVVMIVNERIFSFFLFQSSHRPAKPTVPAHFSERSNTAFSLCRSFAIHKSRKPEPGNSASDMPLGTSAFPQRFPHRQLFLCSNSNNIDFHIRPSIHTLKYR